MEEDIKIANFGDYSCDKIPEDIDRQLHELNLKKENGDIDKAYQLGAALAAELDSNDGEFLFAVADKANSNTLMQRRILLAFAVDTAINKFCNDEIVAKVAINSFFEKIEQTSPHIYSDIRETGAFSCYLVCGRENLKIDSIGQTFAELCNHAQDKRYIELGTALYERFYNLVYDRILSFNFKGDVE